MSIAALGIGYVVLGAAIATAIAIARHLVATDALLVVALWPLYAPFLLVKQQDPPDAREAELLTALARAADSPLAAVLPDPESARILAHRLREAGARLGELEMLLSRPDFDLPRAEARVQELAARGATHAAVTAQLRVKTLGQLRALRTRFREELDEVGELVAQLVAQAELVRLDPTTQAGDLVRELVARLEGLGELLEYPSPLASLS